MQKHVAVSIILLIFIVPCNIHASRSFFVKPMDYNYSVKTNAPEAKYTEYTTQNMPPKLSKSIVAAQQGKNQKLSDVDVDIDSFAADTQPPTKPNFKFNSWKDFIFGQNVLKKPEPVAVVPEVISPVKSLNMNVASEKGQISIEPMQENSVAKFNEQPKGFMAFEDQLFNPAPVASQVNQNVGDVIKQQILDKIPTLAVEDVNKIAELVVIIQEADVKTPGQLMDLKEYKTAKENLYPEGLPSDVSPKLLFEISKSSASEGTPIMAMSEIQQGKQLGAVKPQYVFDSVSAMMKAESKVVNDAQNEIKQSLASQVVAKFDKDAWQANFKSENQADVGQPGFDQMMQHNMDKELQHQIDVAYQDNDVSIKAAGDTAKAQFNSKVNAATKAKNASAKSQSQNNKGNQSQLANLAKINQLKSTAVKQQKDLINQRVEQQFVTQGFNVEIPRDNGSHQMMVMTKAQWLKSYATWHPKATAEEITAKVNDVVTALQAKAYKTQENVAAMQMAQDNAVAQFQAQQTQAAVKSSLKSAQVGSRVKNTDGRISPTSVASFAVQ